MEKYAKHGSLFRLMGNQDTTSRKTFLPPKSTLFLAVLGTLLLTLGSVVGFFIGQNFATNRVSNGRAFIAVPPTVTRMPTSGEVSTWMSYTHPDGFYVVKYPPSLIYNKGELNPNSACKTELILADKASGFSENYQGDIVIDVCKVTRQYYPENAFANIEGNKAQSITLSGKHGFIKTGTAIFQKVGGTTKVRRLAFYENDMEYTIDLRYISENPNLDQIFNQVLSTFKFLD